MFDSTRSSRSISGLIAAIAVMGAFVTTIAQAAGELPDQPFFDSFTLTSAVPKRTVGVSGQRLAVTTLLMTNFDANPQAVTLINPVITGSTCSGPVTGGAMPQISVLLEPRKTLQVQFPTPLVFSLADRGCIEFSMASVLSGGSVQVAVVGFAAP